MKIDHRKCDIRLFQQEDKKELHQLIKRNFLEVNSKDYPLDIMEELVDYYKENKLVEIADLHHLYVVTYDSKLVACGGIKRHNKDSSKCEIITVFVLPEFHGHGIGAIIMKELEQDEVVKGCKSIELSASITAVKFYLKLGYEYIDQVLNDDGLYVLVKNTKEQKVY